MRFITKIVNWLSTPYTIFLIIRDPSISRSAKLKAGIGLLILFAYVISPLDILPDTIPFAGWLDDLIIIPLGFWVLRLITPDINIREKRKQASYSLRRIISWSLTYFIIIVFLVLLWFGLLIYLIVQLVTN